MKWDISDIQNWPWDKHLNGLLNIEPGNSVDFNTGSWRSRRPIWDKEKCTHCLRCFICCPDGSIQTSDGKVTGIDYYHCKGCGICVNECNVNALQLVEEAEAQKAEQAAS